MGYNREVYARIREEYQTKYRKAEAEADRRTAELHHASPELAEIDRKLSEMGASIAFAILGAGPRPDIETVKRKNLALQEERRVLMEKLGYPADYTDPPYECPACKDSGFVGARMCDCMRRALILASCEASGIGQLMRTQSFDTFKLDYYKGAERETMARNLAILRDYAERFTTDSDNLIFYGATGLGKTHLSTSVARRVIERGFDVCYTTAQQLFANFERERFGTDNGMAPAVSLSRYTECDLLILDDLGTEMTNEFIISALYAVINGRLNLRRPTILNTNLSMREIQSRYTDRIASRILGDYKPLVFVGTDVRRQKLNGKA